jgi:hypothetical protein
VKVAGLVQGGLSLKAGKHCGFLPHKTAVFGALIRVRMQTFLLDGNKLCRWILVKVYLLTSCQVV